MNNPAATENTSFQHTNIPGLRINTIDSIDRTFLERELKEFPIQSNAPLNIYFGPKGNIYYWKMKNGGRVHVAGNKNKSFEDDGDAQFYIRNLTPDEVHHSMHL